MSFNYAIRWLVVAFLLSGVCSHAAASTVREMTRIRGEGQFLLSGLGLVAGLRGTGDDGKELAVARPMAALLKEAGNELASPREFSKSKSIALVWVTATIPESGARADDTLDVSLATVYSASSLAGGRLIATILRGSIPGQSAMMIAEGIVDIESPDMLTTGRVRKGGKMLVDFLGPPIVDTFDLIIDAPFAGWATASQLQIAINGKADPINNAAALAIDDRTVQITIPKAERGNIAGFLADVFSAEVNPELLDLPAQVIVNQRIGAIIITGDVQIQPTAMTHKDLSINTFTPPPVGTALNPLQNSTAWTDLKTQATPAQTSKLADLINAFKQLNIPISEQINLLHLLKKSGNLQAQIVID